jgi:hypothetical protein
MAVSAVPVQLEELQPATSPAAEPEPKRALAQSTSVGGWIKALAGTQSAALSSRATTVAEPELTREQLVDLLAVPQHNESWAAFRKRQRSRERAHASKQDGDSDGDGEEAEQEGEDDNDMEDDADGLGLSRVLERRISRGASAMDAPIVPTKMVPVPLDLLLSTAPGPSPADAALTRTDRDRIAYYAKPAASDPAAAPTHTGRPFRKVWPTTHPLHSRPDLGRGKTRHREAAELPPSSATVELRARVVRPGISDEELRRFADEDQQEEAELLQELQCFGVDDPAGQAPSSITVKAKLPERATAESPGSDEQARSEHGSMRTAEPDVHHGVKAPSRRSASTAPMPPPPPRANAAGAPRSRRRRR